MLYLWRNEESRAGERMRRREGILRVQKKEASITKEKERRGWNEKIVDFGLRRGIRSGLGNCFSSFLSSSFFCLFAMSSFPTSSFSSLT